MFLLVAANCCPCRGPLRLDRSMSGHSLQTTMQGRSVVGLTNKNGGESVEEEEAERRERGRGDSATKEEKKDKPEEFSTVSWLVRNEAGQERNGKGDLLVVPVSAGSGLTECTEGTVTWSRQKQEQDSELGHVLALPWHRYHALTLPCPTLPCPALV